MARKASCFAISVLAMVSCVCAQSVKSKAAFPITLHEHLNPSCELIQAATLLDNGKYASVAIPGLNGDIYSPELAKADYLVLAPNVPKALAKLATASDFHVKSNKDTATVTSPQVVPERGSGPCPGVQQALQSATALRNQRRIQVQSKAYLVNFDGVQPPTLLSPLKPELVASTSQDNSASKNHHGKNLHYSGTAIVSFLLSADGSVSQVKIVQSAKKGLDRKAVEVVENYRFDPARKYGLPVPVHISISVAFHLQ